MGICKLWSIAQLYKKREEEKIMTKRFGFTLAEVLITLGIIGVVAAMTIPTLISNTNGAQFKSAYKKALSSLNQAILMNVAMEDTDFRTLAKDDAASGVKMSYILTERLQSATDVTEDYFNQVQENSNGIISSESFNVTVNCTSSNLAAAGTTPAAGTIASICESARPELTGQDAPASVPKPGTLNFKPTASEYSVYALADGTYFGFLNDAENCIKGNTMCLGFIDVNGPTNPNTVIECKDGTGTGNVACVVENSGVKDIYPVLFYEQTVEPATEAARYVLFGK